MKSKKRQRIISWILTFAMIFSVFSSNAAVFATETTPAETVTTESEGFLASASFGTGYNLSTPKFDMSPEFDSETKDYVVKTADTVSSMYAFATLSEAGEGATITAKWTNTSGQEKTSTITSAATGGKWLANLQTAGGDGNGKVVLAVTKGEVTQEYTFTTKVSSRVLSGLTVKAGDSTMKLNPDFAGTTTDYVINTTTAVESVTVTPTVPYDSYVVTVDGQTLTDGQAVVALGDAETKDIIIKVTKEGSDIEGQYKVTINRAAPVKATLKVTPEDAIVNVTDELAQVVLPDENGVYTLTPKAAYTYTVTKYGYVGQSEVLTLTEDVTKEINLVKAAENEAINEELSAYWPSFRRNDNNMALVDAKTPQSSGQTQLKWAKKYGTGYAASPSVQLIVNDKVVSIVSNKIYMIDPETGNVVKEGELVGSTNWGYTPPTYADGIIFCPLEDGTVQAVNAETLESLWVYQDELKGQSLSAITYKDGYVYTGFWNSETADAHYVCLSATDEDPTQTTEAKLPTWTYTQAGGFYWAGSIAIGDVIVVGTDDGQSGNTSPSNLLSLDAKTGKVISKLELVGDQRSAIAYDKESGRLFGTTKAGYLFSVAIDKETGILSDLKTKWYGQDGDYASMTMSTSTPIVYKGVAYFGYTASGNFGGSGYCVIAADANTLEEKYRVPLLGYPQGSGLISTAYEETDGYIYMYWTYNNMPGGITMIKVKPDAKRADEAIVEEIYDAKGYAQYCITSLICDNNGTIYYKNDSGNIFAVASCDAYLNNIEFEGGNPQFIEAFKGNVESYEVTLDPGTTATTLKLTAEEGMVITVDGEVLEGTTKEIALTEGMATTVIKVTKNGDERTYTVYLRERSEDATLGAIKVNESNAFSGLAKSLTPEFAADVKEYVAYGASSSRSFENLWPDAADNDAEVKVYAVSGVAENRIDNEETGEIEITNTNSGHNRYAIYFADDCNTAIVKVVVTNEAKTGSETYYVTITKNTTEEELYAEMLSSDDLDGEYVVSILKEKAAAEIETYKANETYSGNDKEIYDYTVSSIQKRLAKAETKDDVIEILEDGKAQLDLIETDAEKVSVTLDAKTMNLEAGECASLTATVFPESEEAVVWTSSDESIATVDETGKVTGVGEGLATITASYKGAEGTCTVQVKEVPVAESFVVYDESGNLITAASAYSTMNFFICGEEEGTFDLGLKDVTPADASTKVTWTSSNKNVTIDKSGKVTVPANFASGSSKQYVTFTATSVLDSSVKAQFSAYFMGELTLDKSEVTLTIPENGRANYNNMYINPQPQDYNNYKLLKWEVEDSSIVEIDTSGNSVCFLIPKKAGTTTVTATDINNPENTKTCTVTVEGFFLKDEAGEVEDGFITKGKTVQLKAVTDDAVVWTTSDESVVTVDEKGLVTGVKVGQATITATTDKAAATYKFTVLEDGKVYPQMLYTDSYNNLYTDEACTTRLTSEGKYLTDTITYTNNVYNYDVTNVGPYEYYMKSGTSNASIRFGANFDAEAVKVEILQDGKDAVVMESNHNKSSPAYKTVSITSGVNEFKIRVTSLKDEKVYTEYSYKITRQASGVDTLKSTTVTPAERAVSALLYNGNKEGVLFRMNDDGSFVTGGGGRLTTGFSPSHYLYQINLFDDVDTFKLTAATTDTVTGKMAVSTDNGETWKEMGESMTNERFAMGEDGKTVVKIKVVGNSAYDAAKAEGQDPFTTIEGKVYTYNVQHIKVNTNKTKLVSFAFDENCDVATPGFDPEIPTVAALVAHEAESVKLTFAAGKDAKVYATSVSDANLITAVSEDEAGNSVYEIEVATPLSENYSDKTQRIYLVYTDEEGNTVQQNYTAYLFKVGSTKGILKGLPDDVVGYLCIGSQYTSGGNTAYGMYGVYPEKTLIGAGNWNSAISIGNFGGYMTYYYEDPITDDASHEYGVDFTVFGNSNGGKSFTEPGNVLVSEDGKTWYSLAGSEHYDELAEWNYSVTYKDNDGGIANYKDSFGNEGSLGAAWSTLGFPAKNWYPLHDWQEGEDEEITVTGTRLYGSAEAKGTGIEMSQGAAFPAFGYVDVHKNSSTVAGTGEDVNLATVPVGNPYTADYDGYGDGFDLKWAVDSEGNPVDVSDMKFHYVKVQTASFLNGGAVGEKSTEVNGLVRVSDGEESKGETAAPEITVAGKTIALRTDENVYYATVKTGAEYDVTVTPDGDDANVYINNLRAETRTYSELPDKGIVRIIVQEGEAAPAIYYIYICETGTDAVVDTLAMIDALGDVEAENLEAVEAARTAYDALTKEQQAEIENIEVLKQAEEQLAYASVMSQIDEIGAVTSESKTAIEAARAAYDALPSEEQAKVENYQTLVNAELAYENIQLRTDADKTKSALEAEIAELEAKLKNVDDVNASEKAALEAELAELKAELETLQDVKQLAVPTDIKASNIAKTGKVKVTWNAVEGADEYVVYRATSKDGSYKKLFTTTGTSYTNTSAKAGKTYYYKVKAVTDDKSVENSEFSKIVKRTCDLARPVVKASNVTKTGKVILTWNKVIGAEKYVVYRATSKDGTYKKMFTTTATSYTNTSAKAGKTYYYKVKAIDADNTAANSAYSVVDKRTCDLAKPVVTAKSTNKGQIKLSWMQVSGAEKYVVYRATSKDGKYTKITTTTKLSYTNKSLTSGKTYYYKVKAIDADNSSANSAYSTVDKCTSR